jgi:hypothetical protein
MQNICLLLPSEVPMEISNLVYAFFDSDGPGGVVILAVLLLACVVYYVLTRWILAGGEKDRKSHAVASEPLPPQTPGIVP